MGEIILLNVTGEDHPGLTAALTETLARHGASILDIGQAVIHDHLSLGMLLEVPAGEASGPVLKDLLFQAHQLGLQVQFTPVAADDFAGMLRRHAERRPHLLLLSACHSAERSPADSFSGYAPALLEAGVPALLAMAGAVPVLTARAFTAAFYRRLLEHGLVDLIVPRAQLKDSLTRLLRQLLGMAPLQVETGNRIEPAEFVPDRLAFRSDSVDNELTFGGEDLDAHAGMTLEPVGLVSGSQTTDRSLGKGNLGCHDACSWLWISVACMLDSAS